MPAPKPRLSFAAGVTGHRLARLETDKDRLAAIASAVTKVFAAIDMACRAEAARHPGWYADDAPLLRVVSNLADGADQIAIATRPQGWSAAAILPKPRADYLKSLLEPDKAGDPLGPALADRITQGFAAALGDVESVAELPIESGDGPEDGYARASLLMLRQIDMLIAVWDGKEDGHIGGAGDVVKQALAWSIPVVWIASNADHEPALIARMSDVALPFCDACAGPIEDAVKQILGTGDDPRADRIRRSGGTLSRKPDDRLDAFLMETLPDRCHWVFYKWLTIMFAPLKWRFSIAMNNESAARDQWKPFLSQMPPGSAFTKRLDRILLPRFAAADALASWYAHAYRSAYVLAYGLAMMAVCIALTGFVFHRDGELSEKIIWHKFWLVSGEIVMVVAIILIVWLGSRHKWHDRWLDYRALAETLRHLRILGPLGQYEPARLAEASARPGAGWLVWYLRATMRELGPPDGLLDSAYQHHVLDGIEDAEIDGQIEYHEGNEKMLDVLHRRLHFFGNVCFVVTALVLVGFLVFVAFDAIAKPDPAWFKDLAGPMPVAETCRPVTYFLAQWSPLIGVIAALLPALGAAVSGIRFTGDFDGFAERSAETAEGLRKLKEAVRASRSRLDFDDSSAVMVETARLMTSDLLGWRALYGRKRLTLPA